MKRESPKFIYGEVQVRYSFTSNQTSANDVEHVKALGGYIDAKALRALLKGI